MAIFSQLGLQNACSPVIIELTKFHDHVILLLVIILTFVTVALISIIINKLTARFILDAQTIETIWTATPAAVLVILALPSLRILYIIEEVNAPIVTVKAIGHQWYWEYEYSDITNALKFDAFIKPSSELAPGDFRLLEVDHRTVLPLNREIRAIITSADVLHAWTVPSLGVKADAVPGRLNQLGFSCIKPRVLYGQCSEICGANHSFMPIALEFISWKDFAKWLSKQSS